MMVDESGETVTEDKFFDEGLVRSTLTFSRYIHEPGVNAASFDADGFFRTGDRLYTRGGKIFFDNRIKDIIIVKGWQVSPTELEAILMQHPQILDVAVFGVLAANSSDLNDTVPRAFVVRRSILTDCIAGPTPITPPRNTITFSQTHGDATISFSIRHGCADSLLQSLLIELRRNSKAAQQRS